ncbi:thiamine pyrophosphate-dependent enzyme [Streptomyces acidicola]|uniref:thiamine pyrophosphate-dependent enzyme n=1 Tax=Streptomyces acidicola TaxID=2596892 RepID=UPI001D1333F9|nr:thiamine pyrophosphate-dependent enzyme [Streptomyces acidicola]
MREQPVRDSAPHRKEGCFQPEGCGPARTDPLRGRKKATRTARSRLAERARTGDGPALLEAETYRHFGHSRADPATYRPPEEVEKWLGHDPLDIARGRLTDLRVPAETLADADERARDVVQRAVDAAKAAPGPDPREALTDVWADGGAAWRT